MSKLLGIVAAVIAAVYVSAPAFAASSMMGKWTLSAPESKVAFGSIKKGKAGEVHHFKKISGSAGDDGTVTVAIELASVETYIDKRNMRMVKFVFDAAHPKAYLKTKIDPAKIAAMKPGDTATVSVTGTLSLNGKSIPIETDMFVAKLTDNKIIATTDEMIMLSMVDAGIDGGISKLMEVAKLPSIARVSPVTLRLVFKK